MKPISAFKIVAQAGGPAAVSRALGITQPAVSQWRYVPPQHVLKLEELTGISRHKIRPDIFGEKERA